MYDCFSDSYNVARLLDSNGPRFDRSKHEASSALYMPGPYAMVHLLAFTLSTALIIHTIHGHTIYTGVKRVEVEEDYVHAKLMKPYPEVPCIWYASISLVFFVAAIVAVEIWPTDIWAMSSPLSIGRGIPRRLRVRFFIWSCSKLVSMRLTLLV